MTSPELPTPLKTIQGDIRIMDPIANNNYNYLVELVSYLDLSIEIARWE